MNIREERLHRIRHRFAGEGEGTRPPEAEIA